MNGQRLLIWALALVALPACNRIPLTPPDAGEPLFVFEGTTWEGAFLNDEASGAWSFATDTIAPYIQHAATYTDHAHGGAWQLVYHRAQPADSNPWSPGQVEHRAPSNASGNGQLLAEGSWLEWSEWSVNGEPMELDDEGGLLWMADANGVVELACELEWEIEGDAMEQEFEVVLEGLDGCDAQVLPGLFGVEIAESNGQGVEWHFSPPAVEPGMVWYWEINGEEFQTTEGPEGLDVDVVDVNEELEIEVRLFAVPEDNHPYGVFNVVYRASWEVNWEDGIEEWFYADPAPLTSNAAEPSDWMELRYRSAAGDWYSSELLCDEADLPNWKFEVLEVMEPAQSSLYPTEERIGFSCTLPLRPEGQWEDPLNTVEVSGTWPVMPLD